MKQELLSTFSSRELDNAFSQSSGDIWLGLSGGLDSVVLLDLLVSSPYAGMRSFFTRFKVIHINHALSPNAEHWQQQCACLCEQYGIHFEAHKVFIDNAKKSVEEAARIARYTVFSKHLQKDDTLLLAHHANDQMETLLFRLLRGTGGKGLGGIPRVRALVTATGSAQIIRPLLSYSKSELVHYAQYHKLTWVDDESNDDTQYSRNFIRHNIVPSLQSFESKAEKQFAKAADRTAFDYQMLELLAFEKIKQWTRADNSLSLTPLTLLNLDERCFWLRHYLLAFSLSLTQPQLEEVEQAMFSSSDRSPCFDFANGRLMRYQEGLYVLPLNADVEIGTLVIGQKFIRQYDEIILKVLNDVDVNVDGFSLVNRPDGTAITLYNGHSRKIKKWLNDYKVPLWWRDHLPYVFYQAELVAIGSLWIAPNMEKSLQIEWRKNGLLPWPQLNE